MADAKHWRFNSPDIDFSGVGKEIANMTEDEADRIYARILAAPKEDLRQFVKDVREKPWILSSWDMSIGFEEFARRVMAGEYD